jgi:hypothetical protein
MAETQNWFDMRALKRTFSGPTVLRSILVAVVVGSVLNLINQGAEIVSGKSVDVLKLLLTYAVPFLVVSYGAYSAFAAKRGT